MYTKCQVDIFENVYMKIRLSFRDFLIFLFLFFFPILMFLKAFSGHFSCSLRKSELNMYRSSVSQILFSLTFYLLTWDDLDLYPGHKAQ